MAIISEEVFQKIIIGNINCCVSWFLMASYMYYKKDKNLMLDSQYDELGKRIAKELNNITHPHFSLLTIEKGMTSTFDIKEYPSIVRGAALQVYNDLV
jgi:hypothetical protein